METISIPSFLLPTASELLIPSSFLPCSSHLTLQRIGRSRIIFIKIQTPVFYKYLLEIAFFYCEVQHATYSADKESIISKVVIFDIFTLDFSLWKFINNIKKGIKILLVPPHFTFLRNLRSLYLWVSSAPISAEPRVFKLLGLIPLYCNELFKVSQCHALIVMHWKKRIKDSKKYYEMFYW